MLWLRTHSTKQLKTSNSEIRARLRQTVIKYSIVLGIALAYLIFLLCTGIGIPCIFSKITGLKCVGCGISRMFVSLFKLDIVSAFWYNPFLFITGPFLLAYLAVGEIRYIRSGSRKMGKWEIFLWIELALAIVYGIFRNIFPI